MDSEKKALMLSTYRQFMETGLGNGDPVSLQQIVDTKIVGFGTAMDEKIQGIEEVKTLLENQKEQGKALDISWKIVPISHFTTADEQTAVFADDVYLTIKSREESIDMYIRFSTVLNYVDGQWKVIHWHGSKPEQVESGKDTWGLDLWKQKAAALEQLVEEKTTDLLHKNRELQIEAALEKVRSVAMGMKAPEDMLSICKTISQQLEALGLRNIRNVQTAIFYPDRGRYMNYEFYAKHDKTFVTDADYRSHPIQQSFARKMMKGPHEEHREHLKGKQLRDWYDFLLTTNQFADEYILQAESLDYYLFSLGPVALGISTYAALEPGEIDLFKRFIKVFELAYQRYLDIEKALLQAKEAQTELALERIRAKVTAMMESKDLLDIVVSMRKEFVELGHEAHYFWYMRWLPDQYEKAMTSGDGTRIGMIMTLPRHIHGDIPLLASWEKSTEPAVVYPMDVDAAIAYVHKMVELGNFIQVDPQAPTEEDLRHINGLTFVMARTTHGEIGYSLPGEVPHPPASDIATLVRFAGVFDLAYRRFEDLQQAEKRNRETQIELALERVRAKAMAMHESRELGSVAAVMFDQMRMLGGELFAFGIVLCDPQKSTVEQWHGLAEGDMMTPFEVPIDLDYIHRYRYDQWKAGVGLFSIEIPSDYIARHFELMFALPSVRTVLDDLSAKGINLAAPSWEIDYGASFKHGYLLVSSLTPFAESHVFPRFAKVFEQAYTRFLDLQKAEAQAREAQIEVSLERTRTQSMLMQHSDEIKSISNTFHEQLIQLGIPSEFSYVWLPNEPSKEHQFWASWSELVNGKTAFKSKQVTYPLDKSEPYTKACFDAWAQPEVVLEAFIPPTEVAGFFEVWKELLEGAEKLTASYFPEGIYYSEAYMRYGCFGINIRRKLTEEEKALLKRFSIEFERAYTRFLDLKKAEAQAREAQIEAALERVRSRGMGMQKSHELTDVIQIVYDQMAQLNMPVEHTGFILDYKTRNDYVSWIADHLESPSHIVIPYFEAIYYNRFNEAKREGAAFFAVNLDFDEKNRFYQDLFRHLPGFPEESKSFILEQPALTLSTVLLDDVALYIENFSGKPYSNEENGVLMRFGKVFQQTYTRFLDLQKAEAQAREAQIETALERVRSRTMGMQQSDELKEAAMLLFQQVVALGVPAFGTGFNIWDEDRKYATAWMAGIDRLQPPFKTSCAEDIFLRIHEAAERGETLFVEEQGGESLKEHYDYMASIPVFKEIADNMASAGQSFPAFQIMHCAFFSLGYLMFITFEPVPEAYDIFKRFAKVFEQTYTRFLDLKKAEAQAREAQIEAALERVRSRTMGMQKSTELNEVAFVLFEQVRLLGGRLWGTGFVLCDKQQGSDEFWFANEMGIMPAVSIPNTEDDVHVAMLRGWKQNQEYLLMEKGGDALAAHYAYLYGLPQMKAFFDPMLAAGFTFPQWQQWHAAYFSKGYLLIITTEPHAEPDIFKRFAKVFDQTYTRFLDLQKAEAQAREAQIEAALERVRSRTMAMQKSSELPETSYILSQQLKELGEPSEQLTIGVVDEENKAIDISATLHGNMLKQTYLHSIDEPYMMSKVYKAWKNQLKTLVVELKGDELNAYNRYRNELTKSEMFPTNLGKEDRRIVYAAFFSKGMLALAVNEPRPPQSLELLERFASVFDLTYTRFLDLQKAEAQAREAQIEAALERVRSKAMAMHNSDEVGESVATLFEELLKLGVLGAGDRCGIGIMQPQYTMEAWTAAKTHDGKAELTIGILNMTLHPLLKAAYEGWVYKKDIHQYILEGKDKDTYAEMIRNQVNYKIRRDNFMEAERMVHTDFYFKEGCLYVFSHKDLLPEIISTYKRFTIAFGQTYTRYQDLRKAEAQARQAQIEAALESIRSKAMAMRTSEDIAETTAASFAELKKLGISSFRSGVGILTKGSRMAQVFADTRAEDGQTRALSTMRSMDEHPALQQQYTAWEKQEDYEQFLSGDELITYYSHPFFQKSNIDLQNYSGNNQECGYYFAFPDGLFYAWSYQPYTEDEKNILRRFRNIISLTFRRYLDLQKAEAQAREATKQASLDRVRAVIASMRSAEDLELITPLIFKELTTLGVPFIRCGVFIIHEDRQIIDAYLSSPSGASLGVLHLPFQASELTLQTVDAWRNGQAHRQHWSQADFIAWTKQMMDQHQIESSSTYQGADAAPESLDLHFVPFAQGMLYVGALQSLGDQDLDLVIALAKSFSIAYARYEDFVKLEMAKANIESTLTELKATQAQLVQQEKLASLGQLTAGIAHEIQNPLNFVNNFSEINAELSEEILEAAAKGDIEEVKALAIDIKSNQEKIREHGKRADSIVKGMLQHSRSSSGAKEPTNIASLADEYLRLAYHGMRAKDKSFNASIKTAFEPNLPLVPVVAQDIGRVLLNLFNNAFDAVSEKQRMEGDGYVPELIVQVGWADDLPGDGLHTRDLAGGSRDLRNSPNQKSEIQNQKSIAIAISDNGTGIPEAIKAKIFQPFFTTKPTGQGTGLGLSLSYDIIKSHGGDITVNTKEGEGTEFIVQLPTNREA